MIFEEEFIFDFNKHIKQVTPEMIKAQLKKQNVKRFIIHRKKSISIEERVKEELKRLNENYTYVKSFFNSMQTQKYCDISSNISTTVLRSKKDITVTISRKRKETFEVVSVPEITTTKKLYSESDLYFDNLERKEPKRTKIRVKKNNLSFQIIIAGHFQKDIQPLTEIIVDYSFSTEFKIGDASIQSNYFTKNIFDKNSNSIYGKPGEVYYRHNDGFYKEISKAIGTIYSQSRIGEKENFSMNGEIRRKSNKELLYRGDMDSTGSFPFFIEKDDKSSKSDYKIPTNKLPELVLN